MSDAIRVALESAIRTYESMSPGVITVEHKQAIEALQALQSGEPDTKTHINLCHSGEPVVDVIGMDEEDAMFTQIEAKARATYRRHTSWAKGQNISRGDGYESHLVWAAIDWAKANTTPQPVADYESVIENLLDGIRAVASLETPTHTKAGASFKDIQRAWMTLRPAVAEAEKLLSAGKGPQ